MIDVLSDPLAAALLARRVQRGDRVALNLQNVPQFVIGLVANWKAGFRVMRSRYRPKTR